MTSRFIVADVRDALRSMPDNSVDLVISSPPFLALRSYLPADHEHKHLEIGSEATPGAFLDTLLDIVEECARVLAPHGSLCIELGDTYSGSGGAGGDYADDGLRAGAQVFDRSTARLRTRPRLDGGQYANHQNAGTKYNEAVDRPIKGSAGWPEAKSLCLIPQSFAWALSYGRNPFTGRETERWRVRNIVRWCRPNPPVGALGDKFRPATSEMVVACKARDRYFDLDAVRNAYSEVTRRQIGQDRYKSDRSGAYGDDVKSGWTNKPGVIVQDRGGAPPLDWWEIPRDDTEALRDLASENAALWAMLEQAGVVIDPTRFHPATSELIVATKARDRYFDLDAVRHPHDEQYAQRRNVPPNGTVAGVPGQPMVKRVSDEVTTFGHPAGAPPLDWWEIPTQPYKGAHYASFPEKLVVKPIKSMCPERVCTVCGEPSRRIVGDAEYLTAAGAVQDVSERPFFTPHTQAGSADERAGVMSPGESITRNAPTLGWTECDCERYGPLPPASKWRRGIVLDIFAGSGTTLAVAEGLGRDSIGIDLDARNADLAQERCGMFLSVEYPDSESVA